MKSLPVELVQAACYTCDPKTCKEILDSGFDINTQDEHGATILMYAVEPDRFGDINAPESILKLIKFFLEQGADPHLEDNQGRKAVDYARQFVDPGWTDMFGYPLKLSKQDIFIMNDIIARLEN